MKIAPKLDGVYQLIKLARTIDVDRTTESQLLLIQIKQRAESSYWRAVCWQGV